MYALAFTFHWVPPPPRLTFAVRLCFLHKKGIIWNVSIGRAWSFHCLVRTVKRFHQPFQGVLCIPQGWWHSQATQDRPVGLCTVFPPPDGGGGGNMKHAWRPKTVHQSSEAMRTPGKPCSDPLEHAAPYILAKEVWSCGANDRSAKDVSCTCQSWQLFDCAATRVQGGSCQSVKDGRQQ